MLAGLRKYLLPGALCLLAFIVIQFPAGSAFALFAPAGVGAFGVEGTLWQGRARIISVGGMQLRNTEWDIDVLRLLTGRLGGDVSSRWGGGFIDAHAYVSLFGNIALRDVRASFDIAPLSRLFGTPQIAGLATVNFSEVDIADNWPQRLVGDGEIRGLASPLMGQGDARVIGNIGFEFDTATETDVDTITGRLRDTGGPLELGGTLVLKPPGQYELKTRVRARDEAPAALRRNLRFLGEPEADGKHIFQLAGSV